MTESCENCRFSHKTERALEAFDCRIRGPRENHPIKPPFPRMNAEDWCGEYQRKPDPNKEISFGITFASPVSEYKRGEEK